MTKKLTFPLYTALFLTLFLVISGYTLTNMASVYILADLGGGRSMATYTITFFGLGNALGIPLGKPLAKRFGLVSPLLFCLFLYGLCSLGSALSTTLFVFVLFRFLAGLAGGPFYTMIMTILTNYSPPERKPLITSLSLSLFIIGPSLGAAFGGWIAYEYTWQLLFQYTVLLSFLLIPFFYFFLHPLIPKTEPIKDAFDWMGYLCLFTTITSFGFIATTGQVLDWFRSHLIVFLTLLGLFSFILFLIIERFSKNPLLNLPLLKKGLLSFALFNLGILFSLYFAMITLLTLWLKFYANYTPIWIGIVILIMSLASFCPIFLITGKMDPRILLGIAIVFFAISSFYTSTFDMEVNFGRIALSRLLAGFGLTLFLPALFCLAFRPFPEEKHIDVLALFQMTRALSSALGASLYTILWERRTVFYHERLGEGLTIFSENTKLFFKKAAFFHIKGEKSLELLNSFLDQVATSLALEDLFYLMGHLSLVLLIPLIATSFFKKELYALPS